jgi:hypothetical protein
MSCAELRAAVAGGARRRQGEKPAQEGPGPAARQGETGDDLGYSRDLATIDGGDPRSVLTTIVRQVGREAGGWRRVRAVACTLGDPSGPRQFAQVHCDQAVGLAARLGVGVTAALGQIYERSDDKGQLHGVGRRGHSSACAVDARGLPG